MKPIENPENHALIAKNICGYVWKEWYWANGDDFAGGNPNIFSDANDRETAIEAARLKGWYIDIGSLMSGYSTGVFVTEPDCEYNVFPIYDQVFGADQMIYPTRAAAEFAALLWVAQQIAENND